MDEHIRNAAFQWLSQKNYLHGGILPRQLLDQGFSYQGQRITLTGPQGIWKPLVLDLPLSITTAPGSRYDDRILDNGLLVYSYRGLDPNHRDNASLRTIMKKSKPLIYFIGVEPGKYLAEWPVYVVNDNPSELFFTVAIDEKSSLLESSISGQDHLLVEEPGVEYRREYSTRQALVRLHQGEFRIKVLTAYKEQCAFCRLRHIQLLDAAHIIPDGEERGDPIVSNGLSLCKIHHAAYDNNIVGVNSDYKIIVREDVLEEIDGPMLKYGIQDMHGHSIELPGKRNDQPDRERLAYRFERFLKAV